jgi:TolB-like protein
MSGLFHELRRRNVLRVGAAYLVFAWLVLQVVGLVGPILALPEWLPRVTLLALAIGFVVAVVLSWIYELTADGIRRSEAVAANESITQQTGQRLDRFTIAGVALVIAVIAADRLWPASDAPAPPAPAAEAAAIGAVRPEVAVVAAAPEPAGAKSIAVLPFVSLSKGEDDAYFADGLTEEILNSLAQLPELLVTARTSAFHFKGKDVPVPEIAAALGVAHVLEGSVRRSSGRLRITAQLIRAADGFHLWSEVYERGEEDAFAVQDDIATRVASALDVLLDERSRQHMQSVGIRDVEAYAAYQRGSALYEQAHQSIENRMALLTRANQEFDAAIARAPSFFPAYIARTDLYTHLLLDPPFGAIPEEVPAALREGAAQRLQESLAIAMEHARNAADRDAVEVSRIYLSTQWNGLADALARLTDRRECVEHLYGDRAVLFGMAARALPFFERQVACDPYGTGAQFPLVQALVWTGDFERAERTADAALQNLGAALFVSHMKFMARIGRRDFAGARQLALSREFPEPSRAGFAAMVLAAEGRRADAQVAAATFRAGGVAAPLVDQALEAWLGERERANAIAARIDAFPSGAASVLTMVRLCVCGAPFDLEATPNFARQLAESGLQWPPPTVLDLPLKDW